jgi:HAMP domain-containing protein
MSRVTGKAREYTFRHPTLNPTAAEDLPTPFETEVIRNFREHPSLTEAAGVQVTGRGQLFYLAQSVRITDPACLTCHSTSDRAPAGMVAKYGLTRGFGWQLGDVVGAQMLTVPLTDQLRGVARLLGLLAAGLVLAFAISYFALSAALEFMVVRPLNVLATAADGASRGAFGVLTSLRSGIREIRILGASIERLRLSLMKALQELDRPTERDGNVPPGSGPC